MENPYVWPSNLRIDLAHRLAECSLNRYPDPHVQAIRAPLREWMKIPESLDLLFGNGSDEIIALLVSSFIGTGRTVCAPDPSFVMFQVLANQYSVSFKGLPLDELFDIDLGAWLEYVHNSNPALIFIPQPNNPTGNLFSKDRLEKVIESTRALVVIDEAYTAFTDADCLDWANLYPNVVVMRTLSKVGLAGGRFGMLIGHVDWIKEFDKIRLPYNINSLSQRAVQFAIEHSDILEKQSQKIRNERARLTNELRDRGLVVLPSEANFLVVQCDHGQARALFDGLKARNILVKCLDGSHPRLADMLRITIGASFESDALLNAMDQFAAECGR